MNRRDRFNALLTEFRLLRRHAQMALFMLGVGAVAIALLLILWGTGVIGDMLASALFSIPVTVSTLGAFGVAYEYFLRGAFRDAMTSVVSAWDTGVTVHTSHSDAPSRKDVLQRLRPQDEVCLLSTTLNQYFNSDGVEEEFRARLRAGSTARIVLYRPHTSAMDEKAFEEGMDVDFFNDQVVSTCHRFLSPLSKAYPGRVRIRFCTFNVPFGITVIGESYLVVSLNVYGLARSKNQTPCLEIANHGEKESVFRLYKAAFDAVWDKLDDEVPPEFAECFPNSDRNIEGGA